MSLFPYITGRQKDSPLMKKPLPEQVSPQATTSREHEQIPLPEAREVVPGIWKFTLPIPFPLKTVNMYALVGHDGWALVDTGMGMHDARVALAVGLHKAGLSINKLQAIVLSHDHPDHIGLSGILHEKSGAVVYMHPIDANSMRVLWQDFDPERFSTVSHFFRQHGMPAGEPWFSHTSPAQLHHIVRVPPSDTITLVENGQYLHLAGERYRVIWTPGHSDGHICLFRDSDGVFLAADHVLPRITPNIGLYSEYDRANPLADYLDSLRNVAPLPASIVLPGHGEPFKDLAGRVAEIIEHHEEREIQILTLLDDQPQNAYQLAEKLFGHRLKSNEARRMGTAEVLSHLEYLRLDGQVEQYKTSDGMFLYDAL
jgi:glyoxylase-like metal-dependent hydrolase (beta-lactamase superfamily II)